MVSIQFSSVQFPSSSGGSGHSQAPDASYGALARWRHPVAPSEALVVLYQAMRPASYRRIHMAIEIASDSPAFFVVANLLLPITRAK